MRRHYNPNAPVGSEKSISRCKLKRLHSNSRATPISTRRILIHNNSIAKPLNTHIYRRHIRSRPNLRNNYVIKRPGTSIIKANAYTQVDSSQEIVIKEKEVNKQEDYNQVKDNIKVETREMPVNVIYRQKKHSELLTAGILVRNISQKVNFNKKNLSFKFLLNEGKVNNPLPVIRAANTAYLNKEPYKSYMKCKNVRKVRLFDERVEKIVLEKRQYSQRIAEFEKMLRQAAESFNQKKTEEMERKLHNEVSRKEKGSFRVHSRALTNENLDYK